MVLVVGAWGLVGEEWLEERTIGKGKERGKRIVMGRTERGKRWGL